MTKTVINETSLLVTPAQSSGRVSKNQKKIEPKNTSPNVKPPPKTMRIECFCCSVKKSIGTNATNTSGHADGKLNGALSSAPPMSGSRK